MVTVGMHGLVFGEAVRLLGLGSDSRVAFISTEGDTDPVGYRKIVWDGLCPTPDKL